MGCIHKKYLQFDSNFTPEDKDCKLTKYKNDWDGDLNYHVPTTGVVITGQKSDHHNHHE